MTKRPSEPFTMEGPEIEAARAAALQFLKICRHASRRQLAGKPVDSGTPGASVAGRTVISIAIQSITACREDAKISPFDLVDGLAHGLGTFIAQAPEDVRQDVFDVLTQNLITYELRTRQALAQKGPLNG